MIGASTSVSAGVAVLGALAGGIVIHHGRGGDLAEIGLGKVVGLPGGGVIRPAPRAMFTDEPIYQRDRFPAV